MPTLLGIDFETTGLDPEKDKIIEAGFALYDTDYKTVVRSFSVLVDPKDIEIPALITQITGITPEMVTTYGWDLSLVFDELECFSIEADYFCAHNHEFEKSFMTGKPAWDRMPWLDTMTDIPYPEKFGIRKLEYLAHGHKISNIGSHRALNDVVTMFEILKQYEWEEVLQYKQTPSQQLIISFPYNAELVSKIKELGGWRWDGSRKCWFKDVKEFELQREIDSAKAAGFTPGVLAAIP